MFPRSPVIRAVAVAEFTFVEAKLNQYAASTDTT